MNLTFVNLRLHAANGRRPVHASQAWHNDNYIFADFSEFSMKPGFSAKT